MTKFKTVTHSATIAIIAITACLLSACKSLPKEPATEIQLAEYLTLSHVEALPKPQGISVIPGGVRVDHRGYTFLDLFLYGLRTSDDLWAMTCLRNELRKDPSTWMSLRIDGEPVVLARAAPPPPPGVYVQMSPGWKYVVHIAEDEIAGVVAVHIKTTGQRIDPTAVATISIQQTALIENCFRESVDVFTDPIELRVAHAFIRIPDQRMAPWDLRGK